MSNKYNQSYYKNQGAQNQGNQAPQKPKKFNLTQEQNKLLNEAFDLFDMDKAGKIDLHELKLTLRAFGFPSSKEAMETVKTEIKLDDESKILKDDFMNYMTKKFNERDPKEEAKIAFGLFDQNKQNAIGQAELMQAVKDIGENISEAEIKEIVNEFSSGKNGKITQEDFLKIMDDYYFD